MPIATTKAALSDRIAELDQLIAFMRTEAQASGEPFAHNALAHLSDARDELEALRDLAPEI